ncbi:MAG: hypothetical protein PUB21_10970 [Bacteroidales bacterium]|nr:hypothetical protein [Bacteroidales bacterium]
MEENLGKILICQNEKGNTKIDVYSQNGNIWTTQKAVAELYQVRIPTIDEHIKNIVADSELSGETTIRNYLIVQNKGDRQAETAKTIAQAEYGKYDHNRKLMCAEVNELLAEAKRIEKGKKKS